MNITNENKVRIFKKENGENTYYSVGLVKKKQDGTYENGYMQCQFRSNVNVEDKTDIYIKEAWLSFYKKENKTIPYIFINKFETIEQAIEESKKTDPFEEMGEQVRMENYELNDSELPF